MSTEWHKTFLGVRQQHNYMLYRFIDEVLIDEPIERFVEIGTGHGALSVIFGLHAVQRGTHLLTVDRNIRGDKPMLDSVFAALDIEFINTNWWDCMDRIQEYMDKPTFFFCDGGSKAREFNTFSPMLPIGSIIAAHDIGHETELRDLNTDGLVPLLEEYWVDLKYDIRTCFFKKERERIEEET